MKKESRNPLRTIALGVLLCSLHAAGLAAPVALVGERVIDAKSDRPLDGGVVVVEGDRILAVGGRGVIPEGAGIIELEGMTLMPGMINAHDHPLLYADDYQSGHLQASSAYKALRGLSAMQGWLRAGWTGVRVMGDGDVYYANQDIRKAIGEGHVTGPRITGAAHYISTTGAGGDIHYFSPEQPVIADGLIADGVDGMTLAVRNEVKYGSDWIKIMVTGAFHTVGTDPKNLAISPAELDAVMAEAGRLGVPVAAHAHSTAGIRLAVEAGVRSIEHGTYLDREVIELMAARGTYLVPTIYVGDYYAGSDKLLAQAKNDDPHLSWRPEWLDLIGEAHRAGVKIVVGLDLGGNAGPHVFAREFAVLVEAGMPPMAAIKAGTSVAAELLGWDELGTLEPGKLADIIAVPGNPLEDITTLERVAFVMIGGREVSSPDTGYCAASGPVAPGIVLRAVVHDVVPGGG
ncbi:MAG: amidohydrolase family protein [Xanthomonadales bacterium]|nr:amidohydrolase family protein [Xanthomonadales bacterium]NIX14021.1 amidohydrolase family protein [Xanthomonadales bacterium]